MLDETYRHHIFLQPSVTASDGDTEGGAPVSIIEMMATGMPVVSTRHCDIPEVLGPELSDLLAPERDSAALADIIQSLCGDPGRWRAIAEYARHRIETEYNREVQAHRLIRHYRDIRHS
jgi:colanic acid/amylovoran biosynthesis glycosyltransferase